MTKNNLEQYRKIRELGSGGQGEVFLVEDENKKKYALKVYSKGATMKEVEREIRLLKELKHSNIIKMIDFGQLNTGGFYTLTQYLSKGSLTDIEKKRKITVKDKLDIYKDAAHALTYLHHKGVIHRDIKPENIFVEKKKDSYKGYLGDFGLARKTGDSMLTRSMHGAMGTELYLSPEVLLDEEKLDSSSDIYALGISLYKSLTGEFPYGNTAADVIEYLQNPYTATSLSEYLTKVPEELQLLVDSMIHYEKEKRITNLEDCISQIENIQTKYNIDVVEKIDLKKSTKQNGLSKKIQGVLIGSMIFMAGLYGISNIFYSSDKKKQTTKEKEVKEKKEEEIKNQEVKIENENKEVKEKQKAIPRDPIIEWKEDRNLVDNELIVNLLLETEEIMNNGKRADRSEVDKLYSQIYSLKDKMKTYEDEKNYEQAISTAIYLKAKYSTFKKEDLQEYWDCPDINLHIGNNNYCKPKYIFLQGMRGVSEDDRYMRELGRLMQIYERETKNYNDLHKVIQLCNKIRSKNTKNILHEIKSDIYFYGGNRMRFNNFRLVSILGRAYYKNISNTNKYLVPTKVIKNSDHYHGLTRKKYVEEFRKLLVEQARDSGKDPRYLAEAENLIADNKNVVKNFFGKLNYRLFEKYLEKFDRIEGNLERESEEVRNFLAIEKYNFILQNSYILLKESYKEIEELKDIESKRIDNRRAKVLYELIKMSEGEVKKKYVQNFIEVQKKLLKNYSNYKVETHLLDEVISDIGISDLYTEYDNRYFNSFLRKRISQTKEISRVSIISSWLREQMAIGQYASIVEQSKKDFITIEKKKFTQNSSQIGMLFTIMNGYHHTNQHEEGIKYIKEKINVDEVVSKFLLYLKDPPKVRGLSRDEVLRCFGIMSKLYNEDKNKKYFEDVERLYEAKKQYIIKTKGQVGYVEVTRYDNPIAMCLDIHKCYLEYVIDYKEGEELFNTLDEIKDLTYALDSKVVDKERLYSQVLDIYTTYITAYENHKKGIPSRMLNKIEVLFDNKDLEENMKQFPELRKSYKKVIDLYVSNRKRK